MRNLAVNLKRGVSAFLAVAMVLASQPLLFAARQNTGEIAGTAVVEGKPLPSITVRLRNVDTGQLAATTTTNERGEFRFNSLPPGNYVVETVARDGSTLLGTSPRIALVAGAMVATGVTVSTSAAAAAAAGLTGAGAAGGAGGGAAGGAGGGAAGAGAGAGAAAGGAAAGGAFFATTAGIVTAVAIGAGVTAGVVAANKSNNNKNSNNNNGPTATPNTASASR
jgi:hypothetical protein